MSKERKEQITLPLPADLKEELQREAAAQGYTVTDKILFILREYFQKATPPE